MGIIFANLHKTGKIPVLKDKLIMSANTSDEKLFEIFNMYIGILFGPNDFLILYDRISQIFLEETQDSGKRISLHEYS